MQPHVSRTLSVALMVFVALMMLMSARSLPVAAAPLSVINKTATPPPPPTNTPTDLPTATPPPPTATPTSVPTAIPTSVPTSVPTNLPAATPTALPAATATPSDTPPTATPIDVAPTATATRVPETKSANPAISKQADNTEARVGDTINFSIFVTNREDGDAEDVVVTDNLAGYFELINVSSTRGQVSVSGQSITVVLGSMPKGDEVLISVRVRVAEGAPEQLTNSVSLRTSSSSNNPDDDTASTTVRRVSSRIESPGTPTATAAPSAVSGGLPTATPAGAAGGIVPPARPRRLPSTGDAGGSAVALLLGLALIAIAASMLLRRSARDSK